MRKLFAAKTLFCIISMISCVTANSMQKKKELEATITNGQIQAHLYLPDANNGYYRGVRFDWGGIISDLSYKGHTYFGKWFDLYAPTNNDAIMGPVEVFDPLEYNETTPGNGFIKIGVGTLAKADNSPYNFQKAYQIINPGKWNIEKKSDRVIFLHTLNEKQYAYLYTKTVQLMEHKPILVISHSLKNTGTKTIETTVYDHNFFMLDKQAIGTGLVLTLPFELNKKLIGAENYVEFNVNKLSYLKNSDNHYIKFEDLTDGKGSTYDLKVENYKTGAGVRITGDQPIEQLAFWSSPKTVCPEPYIKIIVKPGQEICWRISYEFYCMEKVN